MSDTEFQGQTRKLIAREFGLGGLARYLASLPGKGDYTAERQQKPQPSIEEFMREHDVMLERLQKNNAAKDESLESERMGK